MKFEIEEVEINLLIPSRYFDFSIGQFQVLYSRNMITKGQQEFSITPKMLAVLQALASNAGKTCSKEELLKACWGDVITSDMVLSRVIADLRKVFGDSAKKQFYIETVTKQGYRLAQEIEKSSSSRRSHVEDSNIDSIKVTKITGYRWLIVLLVILMTSVIFALVFSDHNKITFSKVPKLNNLSKDILSERHVRFSPDGKYVVYEKIKGSSQQIVLQSLVANNMVYLSELTSNSKLWVTSPIFSADGQAIIYRKFTPQNCHFVSMNLISRIRTALSECPNSTTDGIDLNNNQQIAILTEFVKEKTIERVIQLDLATGKKMVLAEPEKNGTGFLFPRVSPNGKTIAFVYYDPAENQWSIGLIDQASKQHQLVLNETNMISQVVWGQDNETLFYTLNGKNANGLWHLDLTTLATEKILFGDIKDMDYNRNSNQFAFVKQNRESQIFHSGITNDDEFVQQSITDTNYYSMMPKLSPDTKYLAYITNGFGTYALKVINLKDYSEITITETNVGKLTDPTWYQDNQQLIVTHFNGKSSETLSFNTNDFRDDNFRDNIVNIDFSSTNIINDQLSNVLINDEANISVMRYQPQWTSDGNHFYWLERNKGKVLLMELNISSGKIRSVLQQSIIKYQVTNEGFLYYQERGTRVIKGKLLSKNKQHASPLEFSLSIGTYSGWDAHNDKLFFIKWSKQYLKFMLHQYDLVSKETHILYPIESNDASSFEFGLSVSKDGKNAYYVKQTLKASDVFIMSVD